MAEEHAGRDGRCDDGCQKLELRNAGVPVNRNAPVVVGPATKRRKKSGNITSKKLSNVAKHVDRHHSARGSPATDNFGVALHGAAGRNGSSWINVDVLAMDQSGG